MQDPGARQAGGWGGRVGREASDFEIRHQAGKAGALPRLWVPAAQLCMYT